MTDREEKEDMGDDTAIDNETRRSIYKHILNYPGVHFIVLKDIFGIPEGTLRYHLRYLEKKNRIISRIENGRRCFYASEARPSSKHNIRGEGGRLSEVQNRILKAVRKREGITQKELCSLTKLNRFTLMYNINKLISSGIVRSYKRGREIHYEYISDSRLKNEILRRAAIDLLNGRIDEEAFEKIASRLKED
jgi:predicted transcriptional regulator